MREKQSRSKGRIPRHRRPRRHLREDRREDVGVRVGVVECGLKEVAVVTHGGGTGYTGTLFSERQLRYLAGIVTEQNRSMVMQKTV